ncbi:MAG: bifunctional phosphopantothenoylcysteine decarboxylase/phosphopantothenate--cysteine ligase CoaBC [Bdellovibrionales bacterium]|nr:bifunctional phosphopantothenoylcysteine decarboxylase/phosphopantothenate--cysteine ligase CoaBC [Bdellovibrionales bacterium]
MSGSVAAYKAAALVSRLRQSEHYDVRVVMTKAAEKFVGASTFEALSQTKVYKDLWAEGETMEHIDLGNWADLMLVYPATANLINSWANGLATDLAGSLHLAFPANKPLLLAPAMNTKMLNHPATRESLQLLKARGVKLLEPSAGQLACGEVGDGRLMGPDLVFQTLEQLFPERGLEALPVGRVLLVYGGTKVPIDRVRSITNTSTGSTGACLVSDFLDVGLSVDVLRAKDSVPPINLINSDHQFVTYDDLKSQLKRLLSQNPYDYVVQLAAVSDYSVVNADQGKVGSEGSVQITLKPTEKLINQIKRWSKVSHPIVVAFKLTVEASAEEAKSKVATLVTRGGVDFVVQNDLASMSQNSHPFRVFDNDLKVLGSGGTRAEMAQVLLRLFLKNQLKGDSFKEVSL